MTPTQRDQSDSLPGDCAWCQEPISSGGTWARVTTEVYVGGEPVKGWWLDFHHDPAVYEICQGNAAGNVGPGACLWHHEQD